MSVFWRSWIIVVVLVITVLAVLAMLTALQFNTILSHFIHERLSVVSQTSQASFRAAVGLGLPLSSVRNSLAILERARQTDPNISAIHVFDVTGRILHSTDPKHTTSVRAEALFAQSVSEGDAWHTEIDEAFLNGSQIRNHSNEIVGGLVIVYPRTDLVTSVGAMTARLLIYSTGVLIVVSIIGIGVLKFGLRDLIRVFTDIEAAFAFIERRQWRQAAGGSGSMPEPVRGFGVDTEELTHLLQSAEKQYIAAGQMLAAMENPHGSSGTPGQRPDS